MVLQYLIGKILGATAAGLRVYPVMIPQEGSFPAIRLTHTSLVGDNTKSPVSCLDVSSVQASIFAHTYSEAWKIAYQVRDLIDRTAHYDSTANGIISSTAVDSIRDGVYDAEKRLYHCIVTITVTSHVT